MLQKENVMPEYRRRLPHKSEPGIPVFLTWRLKFTLPQSLIQELQYRKMEFESKIKDLSDEYQRMQRYQFDRKQFDWFDEQIARNKETPRLLANPDLADLVVKAIRTHDLHYYMLHAYSVMSNHVHVLLTPIGEERQSTLAEITKAMKGVSSREINRLLGKEGPLWASESYDHMIRSENEFGRVMQYILDNPVKAGLVDNWEDWPHTWREVT